MLTQGIIVSITTDGDYVVNIPLFKNENDSFEPILNGEAILCTPYGYGGYTAGDVVVVDFLNNSYNHPIIIGKLYNPANAVKNEGAIMCDAFTATGAVTIPSTTKIVNSDTVNKSGFTSIQELMNEVLQLRVEIDALKDAASQNNK